MENTYPYLSFNTYLWLNPLKMQHRPSSVRILEKMSMHSTSNPANEHAINMSSHDCDTFDDWQFRTENGKKMRHNYLWANWKQIDFVILLSLERAWNRPICLVSALWYYLPTIVCINFAPTKSQLNRMAARQQHFFSLDSYYKPWKKKHEQYNEEIHYLSFLGAQYGVTRVVTRLHSIYLHTVTAAVDIIFSILN